MVKGDDDKYDEGGWRGGAVAQSHTIISHIYTKPMHRMHIILQMILTLMGD